MVFVNAFCLLLMAVLWVVLIRNALTYRGYGNRRRQKGNDDDSPWWVEAESRDCTTPEQASDRAPRRL